MQPLAPCLRPGRVLTEDCRAVCSPGLYPERGIDTEPTWELRTFKRGSLRNRHRHHDIILILTALKILFLRTDCSLGEIRWEVTTSLNELNHITVN